MLSANRSYAKHIITRSAVLWLLVRIVIAALGCTRSRRSAFSICRSEGC